MTLGPPVATKPDGDAVTGGPRLMYFTHQGKPGLKPITHDNAPNTVTTNSIQFNSKYVYCQYIDTTYIQMSS